MTHSIVSLAKHMLLGAAAVCSLHAATVSYTVNNYTLSGGDPIYSVATDLTFNSLVLREVYADSTSSAVSLLDSAKVARTSLSTSTFSLNTAALNTVDPTHGAIVSAALAGVFSQTSLSILTSFGGTPSSVTVLPNFTATLPFSSSTININALDANGNRYTVGTLDEAVTAASTVPEPGTLAIASIGLTGLFALLRRRTVHN